MNSEVTEFVPDQAMSDNSRPAILQKIKISLRLTILILLFITVPVSVFAWPADGDWIPIYRTGQPIADPLDSTGSREVAGSTAYPAAYLFNDGTYIYYRIRLDADPSKSGGLEPFGWGFLIDTDLDAGDYEYMIMLDGINNPDVIYLAQNTVQGTLGDPSDRAESIAWQETLTNGVNYKVTVAASSLPFGNNPDYFLDYRMPYDIFKATLGLQDSSLVRYFVGSSNNGMSLTADLVAASTLYDGLSNYVLPTGKQPTTGSITFVSDLAGNGSRTEFYPGETLYLKIVDDDQNGSAGAPDTVQVTLSTPYGDNETFTFGETGNDTGIFTGLIASAQGVSAAGDGILQTIPIEVVTATYMDAGDAAFNQNQPRSDTIRAMPMADVGLVKSVDKPTPNEGETVVFTITANNNGPSPATGLAVTDLLPAGVTYAGYGASQGNYNNVTGIWSIGPLSPSGSAALTISATVNTGTTLTTITNSAAITAASQPDSDPADNTASASIAVTGADLSVAMTASAADPPAGGTVTYTITVTNLGAYAATGVVVRDLLPAGVSWATDDGTGAYDRLIGDWTIGNLAVGAARTLQITANVTAAAGATVTNTVIIQGCAQGDPVSANNSASTVIHVNAADLSLGKTASNAAPDEGAQVTFTLTLTNLSANTATAIQVRDLLPPELTFVSSNGSGSYDQATGIWAVASLAGGASVQRQIVALVDAGTAGQIITNTAAITASGNLDPVSGNNAASAAVTVRSVDIAVSKAVNIPNPNNNQNIEFTVTITNNGPYQATGLSIYDRLPLGVTYQSQTASQGSYNTATWLWNAGTLNSGATATLRLAVRVNLGNNDPLTLINLATLQASTPADRNGANNVGSAIVSVQGTDVAVTKIASTLTPSFGGNVVFTMTATNSGPNQATNLVLTDPLPAGLTYVSSGATMGTYTNGGANNGNWTIGTLNVGATATLTLTTQVTAASGTTILNTAALKSLDQGENTPANNSASVTLRVGGTDLNVAKSVDNPTPTEGQMVRFTVTVTNTGPNAANGVEVSDLLPAGLTYDAHNGSQGSYDPATGLWTVGSIPFPGSVMLTIDVVTDSGTGGSTITNTATLTATGTPDANPANNSGSASVAVTSADLYLTKTVDQVNPDEGSNVIFTLTVGNDGPHDATGVAVSDLLPTGLTWVADDGGGAYDPASGAWGIGNLNKLATVVLHITARCGPTTGGTTITNSAAVSAAIDPNPANDTASISITPKNLAPAITVLKSVFAESDPVNGSSNPFSIPGARMRYEIQVLNFGDGSPDAASLVLADSIPAETSLVVSAPPVAFVDGIPTSGISINYGGLGDLTDDVQFCAGANCDYVPTIGADSTDPSVTQIRIKPTGTMAVNTGAGAPNFKVQFWVLIK